MERTVDDFCTYNYHFKKILKRRKKGNGTIEFTEDIEQVGIWRDEDWG